VRSIAAAYLSEKRDREAAKIFLKRALANPDNRLPHVFVRDGLRSYPAAIRELQAEGHIARHCRQRTRRYSNNRIESDHRHVKRRLRAMQGPRTTATASAVIQGIEAVQMIRKGQVLGIAKQNLHGQAWGVQRTAAGGVGSSLAERRRVIFIPPKLQHTPVNAISKCRRVWVRGAGVGCAFRTPASASTPRI